MVKGEGRRETMLVAIEYDLMLVNSGKRMDHALLLSRQRRMVRSCIVSVAPLQV